MDDEAPRRRGPALLSGPLQDDEDGDVSDENVAHPLDVPDAHRYEVIALIGQGGMGSVEVALDRRLQRQVALKKVRTDRPHASARLAQEAIITAHLDHPAIVPVFNAGRAEDGQLYYTMRLIRGRSFEEALSEAPELAGRLGLMRHYLAACEAVAYAHSVGIAHRDLKPDNIVVGAYGDTQVVDWGVAKPIGDTRGAAWRGHLLPASLSVETLYGDIVGTPAFMAPEQASPGAPPSAAADIFSLGAILYRILAGSPPYEGLDTEEALARVRSATFAATPGWSAELQAIAERAMARAPEARYPSAAALADDVRAWLDGRRVGAYAYSPMESLRRFARAWRIPLMVAGAAAVALIIGGIVATGEIMAERDRALSAESLAEASEARARALLADSLTAQAAQHLEAGRGAEAAVLAARAMTYGDHPRARGVAAATAAMGLPSAANTISLPTNCVNPRLSRSGRRVLCGAGDALEVWELGGDGGAAPRRMWHAPLPHAAATWGPTPADAAEDTRITAIDASRALVTLDARTGAATGGVAGEVPPSRRMLDHVPRAGAESVVAYAAGWRVWAVDAAGMISQGQVCPTHVHVEAAVSAGAKIAVICADGSAALYRTGGSEGLAHVLAYADASGEAPGAGFMAALVGDVLYSASWDGTLRRWCLGGSAIDCERGQDDGPEAEEKALRLDLDAVFRHSPEAAFDVHGVPSP
jgi:tRNA A-37 threonylcarbamoyl transferase component Bud32